jgi:hypothetical protein
MRKSPNSRRLDEHITRALNKIRKPSTAEEITELLNRDLELEDRPFQTKEVAEWLRNAEGTSLTLYWSMDSPPQVAIGESVADYSRFCPVCVMKLTFVLI